LDFSFSHTTSYTWISPLIEFTQSISSLLCVSGCSLDRPTNKSTVRKVSTNFTILFCVDAPTTGFLVVFSSWQLWKSVQMTSDHVQSLRMVCPWAELRMTFQPSYDHARASGKWASNVLMSLVWGRTPAVTFTEGWLMLALEAELPLTDSMKLRSSVISSRNCATDFISLYVGM